MCDQLFGHRSLQHDGKLPAQHFGVDCSQRFDRTDSTRTKLHRQAPTNAPDFTDGQRGEQRKKLTTAQPAKVTDAFNPGQAFLGAVVGELCQRFRRQQAGVCKTRRSLGGAP